MLYDIRKTGQLLSWVEGRMAETNQRLGVDLLSSSNSDGSLEIWAGGVDGRIRVWRDTHCQEGAQQADLEWHAHNGKQPGMSCHSLVVRRLQSCQMLFPALSSIDRAVWLQPVLDSDILERIGMILASPMRITVRILVWSAGLLVTTA